MKVFFVILISYLGTVKANYSSCEDQYKYPCANKYIRYTLDNGPKDFGLFVGQFEPNKNAYLGLSSFEGIAYQFNRLSLDPAGIQLFNTAGPSLFINDTRKMWYLFNDLNHQYTWVDSQNGEIPDFAITVGEEVSGFPLLAGRIVRGNGLVLIGVVVPFMGVMYYADENAESRPATSNYQVLTCKSRIPNEEPILPPKFTDKTISNVDVGCINNWVPYANDKAPEQNGVSAGEFQCCSSSFVGKAKDNLWIPGRIQTIDSTGFYSTSNGQDLYLSNGSYYLVNNPLYSYYWVSFDGVNIPENAVFVRNDVGVFAWPVGRNKIDKVTQIGKSSYPVLNLPDKNGIETQYFDYEFLVCDPWPKFECGEEWRKYNSSHNLTLDGFNIPGSLSYIGRNASNLGQIQINPTRLNYFDNSTATEHSEEQHFEYLVKNPRYTYKWEIIKAGDEVKNALKLSGMGSESFNIGLIAVNSEAVIAKVKDGEDFYFGKNSTGRRSTNIFKVLTCSSPDDNSFSNNDVCKIYDF